VLVAFLILLRASEYEGTDLGYSGCYLEPDTAETLQMVGLLQSIVCYIGGFVNKSCFLRWRAIDWRAVLKVMTVRERPRSSATRSANTVFIAAETPVSYHRGLHTCFVHSSLSTSKSTHTCRRRLRVRPMALLLLY